MAVRRIAETQPESFAFDNDNLKWAKEQIAKYPDGKQASAVIPLLWRAQEQHDGWLPEPAMRYVAEMLDMPYIRVLEVATFYTMYQLSPVGSVAHIQVCGTTPCMLRGSEDLIKVCKKKIAPNPHEISADGKFSWEEVECLGACVNAPMVQVFKDTFEDLTPETFEAMLDAMGKGEKVNPGPQIDRHLSVAEGGRTQLFADSMEYGPEADPYIEPYVMNGNAAMIASDARAFGLANDDKKGGVKKSTKPVAKKATDKSTSAKTSETKSAAAKKTAATKASPSPKASSAKSAAATKTPASAKAPAKKAPAKATAAAIPSAAELKAEEEATASKLAALPKGASAEEKANAVGKKPRGLKQARKEGADDLKQIKGVGKVIEGKLNAQGIWHFDQIAKWGRPEIVWFDTFLSFKGRIDRDTWIEQAGILAQGGETEFSKRVAKGEVESSAGGPSKKGGK